MRTVSLTAALQRLVDNAYEDSKVGSLLPPRESLENPSSQKQAVAEVLARAYNVYGKKITLQELYGIPKATITNLFDRFRIDVREVALLPGERIIVRDRNGQGIYPPHFFDNRRPTKSLTKIYNYLRPLYPYITDRDTLLARFLNDRPSQKVAAHELGVSKATLGKLTISQGIGPVHMTRSDRERYLLELRRGSKIDGTPIIITNL